MKNRKSLPIIGVILMFLIPGYVQAQAYSPAGKYSFTLINNSTELTRSVHSDSSKKMVSLSAFIPGISLDLRYATNNNFVHRNMYPYHTSDTYMRLPAARALLGVQEELRQKNLALKIFDAYRPFSVTKKFWELVHDERYVANPAKGSGHNKGVAVDLTIIGLKGGQELDMGTGFDNFTDSAHHAFKSLPAHVLANRELLKSVMTSHGFLVFDTEWWHYYWPGDFEVLDLGFEALDSLRDK